MKDFIVDTEEQCFLCMAHIPTQSSSVTLSEPLPTQSSPPHTYSVQYLSRYLKMDRLKVFNDTTNIPSHLINQVERAKLKVLLCPDCRLLNQQFSVLFRQLEKTEMEIASCLKLISEKFAVARNKNVCERRDQILTDLMLTESSPRKGLMGKAEVAAVLRKDAIQKCFLKLASVVPRVKAENLTLQKVEERKHMMKVKCQTASTAPATGTSPNIKAEVDEDLISNDDAEYADESDIYTDDDEDSSRLPKLDHSDYVVNCPLSTREFKTVEGGSRTHKPNVRARKEIGRPKNTSPIILPTTLAVIGKVPSKKYKMKSIINPINGKIGCGHCSKQFLSRKGFKTHYESTHLNIKYKCSTNGCSKVFLKRNSLYRHQQIVHMGIRFSCDACKKSFTQKCHLMIHYSTSTSCGRGKSLKPLKMHSCHVCCKEFNKVGNLRQHLKAVHNRH